jgi:hypothetical protein
VQATVGEDGDEVVLQNTVHPQAEPQGNSHRTHIENIAPMKGVVGASEGLLEGTALGRREGIEEGRCEGIEEGCSEGLLEGTALGRCEGMEEGCSEGRREVGDDDGEMVVGIKLGDVVGVTLGELVGRRVVGVTLGELVGRRVEGEEVGKRLVGACEVGKRVGPCVGKEEEYRTR